MPLYIEKINGDVNRPTDRPTNRQGEYRAICLFRKLEHRKKRQRFAIKYILQHPVLQTGASNERAVAEKLGGRSRLLEEAQGFAENKLRVKLQLFVRSGGETKLIARLYFFHILIVDLL